MLSAKETNFSESSVVSNDAYSPQMHFTKETDCQWIFSGEQSLLQSTNYFDLGNGF